MIMSFEVITEIKYRSSAIVVSADYDDNEFSDIKFHSYRKGVFVEVPSKISDKFNEFEYLDALIKQKNLMVGGDCEH